MAVLRHFSDFLYDGHAQRYALVYLNVFANS